MKVKNAIILSGNILIESMELPMEYLYRGHKIILSPGLLETDRVVAIGNKIYLHQSHRWLVRIMMAQNKVEYIIDKMFDDALVDLGLMSEIGSSFPLNDFYGFPIFDGSPRLVDVTRGLYFNKKSNWHDSINEFVRGIPPKWMQDMNASMKHNCDK